MTRITKQWLLREDQAIYQARMSGESAGSEATLRLIDVFAGAGGMSLGFSRHFGHPFQSVWANDNDPSCVETYNANFGAHCHLGDITDILDKDEVGIPIADVVIGGPPCQGFSLLNRNRDDDPRKQLWRPYLEIVKRSQARVFVMENVPQLLASPECDEIIVLTKAMGFKVSSAILCAADYGVPQTRRRAFIVGCKFADPSAIFPPRKTHFDPTRKDIQGALMGGGSNGYMPYCLKWRTVRDAIADLPTPSGTAIRAEPAPLDLHFGRTPTAQSLARYKAIPEEGMNRFDLQKLALELTPPCWIRKERGGTDLFGRLWWDRPAFTIRTEFFKPEKGRYLHPSEHRPITHREAARLQTFPDSFLFKGSKTEVARQIGNAVPPLLAARVADVVYALLRTGR